MTLNPDVIEKISVVTLRVQQVEPDTVRKVLVEFLYHSWQRWQRRRYITETVFVPSIQNNHHQKIVIVICVSFMWFKPIEEITIDDLNVVG